MKWSEQSFGSLSHEPARENDLDSAYSVIDGQFLKDELVSLKLPLDDSAALQVILLTTTLLCRVQKANMICRIFEVL